MKFTLVFLYLLFMFLSLNNCNQSDSVGSKLLSNSFFNECKEAKDKEFISYVKYNNLNKVKYIIDNNNLNINCYDKNGSTALIIASKSAYKDIVGILLNHKDIDVNFPTKHKKQNALIWAVRKDNKEIINLFINNKNINVNNQDIIGYTALILATRNQNKEIVKLLLNKDYSGYKYKIDVNLQDISDDVAKVKKRNALMWASKSGNKDIVNLLLNKKEINLNLKDNGGKTALIIASYYGKHDVVKLLLKKKDINVNLQDIYKKTALMYAVSEKQKLIVETLLNKDYSDYEHKIDIDLIDNLGNTSLIIAKNRFKETGESIYSQIANIITNYQQNK